jgi:hypothetical protein
MTRGLFSPEYADREMQLNDLVQEVVIPARKEEATKRVKQRIQTEPGLPKEAPSAGGIPIPLTPEEADEADRQMVETLKRISATKAKLEFVREQIGAAINTELGGKELSFKVDISKKHGVERALKKLYSERVETITYSMYVDMLRAKTELEKAEVADYASGRIKEDSDSEKKEKNE